MLLKRVKNRHESTFLHHKCRMYGLDKCIQDMVDEIQILTKKLNNTRMKVAQSPLERDLATKSLLMLKRHQMEQTYWGQIRDCNCIEAWLEEALLAPSTSLD